MISTIFAGKSFSILSLDFSDFQIGLQSLFHLHLGVLFGSSSEFQICCLSIDNLVVFGQILMSLTVFDSLTSSSYVMTASYNTDSNFLIPLKKLHSYKISNCVQKFNFQKNEQIFEIEFLCKKLVNFCIKDSFICIRIGIFAPKIISYCVL